MSEQLPLARLLDACHLLEVGLLWDPQAFPDGPTDEQRPLVLASLGVAVERLRADRTHPHYMPAMRQLHGQAFGEDPKQITKHAMTVLSYHAEILRNIQDAPPVEDAASLITAAVSILASLVDSAPYERVRLASYWDEPDGPCTTCGKEH